MNLSEFLRGMSEDDEPAAKIAPDVAVMRLRERAALYGQVDRFKVGDFVTPVKDCHMKGSGDPHLVVETLSTYPIFSGDPGMPEFGARYDMRVMCLMGNGRSINAYWVESHNFIPWSEPVAAAPSPDGEPVPAFSASTADSI